MTTETLKALVEREGMASVLASLSRLLRDEADELAIECEENPAVESVNAVADAVLNAAQEYDVIPIG